MNIEEYVDASGGVISSVQLAEFLGVNPAIVRGWANENGIPMVGNSFGFTVDTAADFVAEVLDDGDDDDDDDDDEVEEVMFIDDDEDDDDQDDDYDLEDEEDDEE